MTRGVTEAHVSKSESLFSITIFLLSSTEEPSIQPLLSHLQEVKRLWARMKLMLSTKQGGAADKWPHLGCSSSLAYLFVLPSFEIEEVPSITFQLKKKKKVKQRMRVLNRHI